MFSVIPCKNLRKKNLYLLREWIKLALNVITVENTHLLGTFGPGFASSNFASSFWTMYPIYRMQMS